MGFFSFIETSFFVSLGITFVLILLMVYHFKERMSCMEQKGDTMFEIINNVVREMTNLKNAYVMQQQLQQQFMQSNTMYNNTSPQFAEEETRNVPIREHVIEYAGNSDSESESESESETESESGTDSESDSENEVDLKNDEVHNDPIYITFDTPVINEHPAEQEPSPVADNVKIINIHLDNYHTNTKSSESPPPQTVDESEVIQPIEETKEEENEDHSIHVNKITNDVEDNRLEAEQKEEEDKKESYKDLTIAQLKALVITKGITTSVSKLKKNELISLLENN
jgi:hypothetical protein